MAAKRTLLLAASLAALVVILAAAVPTLRPDQEQLGPQVGSGYPHNPIIQLEDDQHQMRLIELDARVVEAVFMAPASPRAALLEATLVRFGMSLDTADTVNLYHFVLNNSRPDTVLVPDPTFAMALHGIRDRVASGYFPVTGRYYSLASPELWGRDFRGLVPDSIIVRYPGGPVYRGVGYLVEESVPIGRLLPGSGGHNPPGTDECIKLRTCELICDPPWNPGD